LKNILYRATSGLVVVSLTAGCIPGIDEERINNPHTSSSARPTIVVERRAVDPNVVADIDGKSLSIKVEQTTECRNHTTTPMENGVVIERKLNNGGILQTANILGAATLVGAGIATYAASGSVTCSNTPPATASNPNPASVPCTADQANTQQQAAKGIGIGLVSLAAIPLTVFIVNIFRARNTTHVEPAAPKIENDEWKACETTSQPSVPVKFSVKSRAISEITNAEGRVVVESTESEPVPTYPEQVNITWKSDTWVCSAAPINRQGLHPAGATYACINRSERERTAQSEKTMAELERREREKALAEAAKPFAGKRSLRNPADVDSIVKVSAIYRQCRVKCMQADLECRRNIPYSVNSSGFGAAYYDENCKPVIKSCYDVCEAELNHQGWCVPHNVFTEERSGDGIGPCP
jgi:hypothetical protein